MSHLPLSKQLKWVTVHQPANHHSPLTDRVRDQSLITGKAGGQNVRGGGVASFKPAKKGGRHVFLSHAEERAHL